MRKLIAVRFAGKCRVCKEMIPAGSQAFWFGKGAGMSHTHCSDPTKETNSENASLAEFRHPLKFSRLREEFRKVVKGDFSSFVYNGANVRRVVKNWTTEANWYGCTVQEMSQWLEQGFTVEGLQGVDTSLIPARPKKRFIYAEEGDEMLIDLAWSGIDECFLDVEKRNTKPGLKVEINLCFNANFKAGLIAKYARWVARALQTLEEATLDVEIDFVMKSSGTFQNHRSKRNETRVRVKEAGEASDFASWSAMFSPGGFRQLGFLGEFLAGEHFNEVCSSGLGHAVYAPSWNAEYSEETNTLTISNPGNSNEFPEFEMTQKLAAIMQKIGG